MRVGLSVGQGGLAGLRRARLEPGGGVDDGRVADGVLQRREQRALEAAAVDDDEVGAGHVLQVRRRRLERVRVGAARDERLHLEAVAGDVLGDVGEERGRGDDVEGAGGGTARSPTAGAPCDDEREQRGREKGQGAAPRHEASPGEAAVRLRHAAAGAEAAELQEVVGDAVARLLRGRVDDAAHVAGGELGDPAAGAADHRVAVRRARGHEALAVVGPVHAAQGAHLGQHLQRPVDGGQAQFGALRPRRVVDLQRAEARRRRGDGVEDGAALARQAKAAGGELRRDLGGVEAHVRPPF